MKPLTPSSTPPSIMSGTTSSALIDPAEFEPQTLPGVAPLAALGLAPTLATALSPIEPDAAQDARLRGKLLARVARSAAANRPFVTTRVHDGEWVTLAPGVQQRHLHADDAAQSSLLQWRADAACSLPATGQAHECLVLQGEVHVNGHTLHAQDYLLCPPQENEHDPLRLQARAGTRLYWRRIEPGAEAFGRTAMPHLARANDMAWEPLRRGVQIKPLYAEGERISMLVQFEPGASVPAHGHGHGEECLMVAGDLFLGDVLLCQGDFQFAPRGTGHGELQSDVGCVLYFHGAIDPAVVDPSVRPG